MRLGAAAKAVILVALLACVRGQNDDLGRGDDDDGGVQYNAPQCAAICADPTDFEAPLPRQPLYELNRAHDWDVVLLNQIQQNFGRMTPPAISRVIGVFSSCVYDAVAIQGDSGLAPAFAPPGPVTPGLPVDRVIDGAAYTALEIVFANDASFPLVRSFLAEVSPPGFGPELFGSDPAFLLGTQVCQGVIGVFTADGFSVDGFALAGTTFPTFEGVNLPQETAGITNCGAEIVDVDYWQPLCVPNFQEAGGVGSQQCTVQGFADPDAGAWATYSLPSGNALRPFGPPTLSQNPDEYIRQAREVVEVSRNLGDVDKQLAEYWADGPDTTAPAGHWYKIMMDATVRQGLTLRETVMVMFLMGNALNDAGVAAWDAKVYFNSARPITMIQCGLAGETLEAWIGPYLGVGPVDASVWQPYQAATFVTPNFAGYVSGHSTFSGAAYRILELFFQTGEYLAPKCHLLPEGSSNYEGRIDFGEPGFIDGLTNRRNQGLQTQGYSPATDVVLCWDRWVDAGEESGISRFPGGIHITADHVDGIAMGVEIADRTFDAASTIFTLAL